MCQEAGSIDAWPMRDKKGKLYLIWKEDGNSVKLPTPIWAMEMNESRTKLTGEKKELFRNDAAWESNLVEGVSMIRHGDYFYAFYAGAGCCGRSCSYGIGVARAKDLLGPWEKYSGNPLIAATDDWKCPGHGTPISRDGKYYFLYHAYEKESNVYTGRQGVLSEFKFTQDGWIEFVNGPGGGEPIQAEFRDEFNGNELAQHWQWSVFHEASAVQRNGRLTLTALPSGSGSFLGMKTLTGNYEVSVVVHINESTAESGLALIGDEKNFVSATIDQKRLVVRRVEDDKETIVEQRAKPGSAKIHLKMRVQNGKDILFSFSDDGEKFTPLNDAPIDGFFLPPWDRAVRAAVVARGEKTQKAVFDDFMLKNN
jgi:beta-xylosidase